MKTLTRVRYLSRTKQRFETYGSPSLGQRDTVRNIECQFDVVSSCKSVVGGRHENQDLSICCDQPYIAIVADGMGGYAGGALASKIAVDSLRLQLASILARGTPSPGHLQASLECGLRNAHLEMAAVAADHHELGSMGCTLAIAAMVGQRLFYAHMGDARIYFARQGKMKAMTVDESLVQKMCDEKLIGPSELSTHPLRHIVTNSLSAKGIKHVPHWRSQKLMSGDRWLITSDGLTAAVHDADICTELTSDATPVMIATRLISAALQRDASDNLTCVVSESR